MIFCKKHKKLVLRQKIQIIDLQKTLYSEKIQIINERIYVKKLLKDLTRKNFKISISCQVHTKD